MSLTMLYLYNSLSGERERFVPIEAGKVRMYVCGITPYGYWHIGNARSAVVFDAVRRHLMASGYEVTFVRNITDVDDKIIDAHRQSGEDCTAIAIKYRDAMHADLVSLNVLPPDYEPHATEYIDKIVAMVSTLIDKGHAYATDNGDVYYKVRSFEQYGQLSGQSVEDMQAGVRKNVEGDKQDVLDFALWKAKKPGEPSWPSPWGEGRPGWHIECSAMSTDLLGAHFDIHAGGLDLKFPHHENEIAQSCAATDEKFANYWLHNGMLEMGGSKMSKSLGNIDPTHEVLEKFHPEVVRYYLLSGHYRNPLNYSDKDLMNAKAGLGRLYTALRGLPAVGSEDDESVTDYANYQERFMAAMDDDFNTPEAYAVMFDLARDINRARDLGRDDDAKRMAGRLRAMGAQLGLLQQDAEAFLQASTSDQSDAPSDQDIERLIAAREQARADRDFAKADEIRDRLAAQGVLLEDKGGATSWRRA